MSALSTSRQRHFVKLCGISRAGLSESNVSDWSIKYRRNDSLIVVSFASMPQRISRFLTAASIAIKDATERHFMKRLLRSDRELGCT